MQKTQISFYSSLCVDQISHRVVEEEEEGEGDDDEEWYILFIVNNWDKS